VLRVLYRDASLVVVSKPSGLAVHRGPESTDHTFLLQLLAAQVGAHLYPVHRLDRGTSGVIAFALTSEDARLLQARLREEVCRKEYYALVRGTPPDRFRCDRPLSDEAGRPQEARTDFRVLDRFWNCALVRARLYTGRRHQIRRHLQHEGWHVLGDSTYGKGRLNRAFRSRYGLPRLFLHAARLVLLHPRTGEALCLRDPLPPELAAVLRRLPRQEPANDPERGEAAPDHRATAADSSV
jgi:tRNA pseudouridine65 synthase